MLSKEQAKRRYADGLAKLKSRQYFDARASFAAVAADYPKAAEAWYQIGCIDDILGRPFSAAQCFEHALKAKPDQKEILVQLQSMANRVGRSDYAAKLNRRLVRLDPNDSQAYAYLALSLQQNNDFAEAEKVLRRAIKTWPTEGVFYRVWFQARKFTSANDPVLTKALKVWNAANLDHYKRLHLGFALAKAMEDLGKDDAVFKFLRPANEIGKTLYPFDRAGRRQEALDYLAAAPDPQIARHGSSDFAPIFVIGTPRSGTTLIERIIAAHPEVSAGGEIAQAFFLQNVLMRTKSGVTPLKDTSAEAFASFARQYEITAREVSQATGAHVTDKSIQNNLIIGCLATAFPRARFIIVRRDPCDVALSIYKNFFEAGRHSYSYDLADIASVLKTYDMTIAHWRERVELTEISYDELTADPEPHSRRLIAAAGLEWDDQCLEFYKQKGSVRTLSLAQVRQPIYQKSRQAWRKFETDMAPFVQAWEEMS